MHIIFLLLSLLANHLIWRAINLLTAGFGFMLFMSSISFENDSSSVYPLIIPVIGSIMIVMYLGKLNKNLWIQLIGYFGISLFVVIPQGDFLNYTIVGLSAFILFFNALRPWRN